MKHLLAALALAALPLAAVGLDDTERAEVQNVVSTFETAFTSGDYATVLTTIPPKLLDYMSEEIGMSREDLETTMVTQMEIFLSDIKIESFALDTSAMTTGETSDSMPYAFVPTTTELNIPDQGDRKLTSQTLALRDAGTWYLVRIESKQQYDLVKAIYPAFETIDLP